MKRDGLEGQIAARVGLNAVLQQRLELAYQQQSYFGSQLNDAKAEIARRSRLIDANASREQLADATASTWQIVGNLVTANTTLGSTLDTVYPPEVGAKNTTTAISNST
jgi:hypothetical protein